MLPRLPSHAADPRVSLLGASQALFEASMYTFVFLWTPALSPRGEKLPHGFIFAIFMTASMVGTALAGRLLRSCRLERLMQVSRHTFGSGVGGGGDWPGLLSKGWRECED
jgi:hypothetical protein